MSPPPGDLPPFTRFGHGTHCKRCLVGLPGSQVDIDPSKLALAFYCIGSLDLLNQLLDKTKQDDRESWREWIWEQQVRGPYGAGFKPGPYMSSIKEDSTEGNVPQLIVTYTALLTLAILRDDFTRLDRAGIVQLLGACQREDGSFSTEPYGGDTDLRTVYCAFAIANMLDNWSTVNVDQSVEFMRSCRTYEGGYGQFPFCEAQGGTTYCALAALHLSGRGDRLSPMERKQTIRWLVQNQDISGGFVGRTNKAADACYCFWCGASLNILGVGTLVDEDALRSFVGSCQHKFGGIAKAPKEHPDPYHTYLSLAALSTQATAARAGPDGDIEHSAADAHVDPSRSTSWELPPLDPLLNATVDTAAWAREHIPKSTNA